MIIAVMMLMMELDCRDERHRHTAGALNHEDRPRDEITGPPTTHTHTQMDGRMEANEHFSVGGCVHVCVCVYVCLCVFVFVCLCVR